MNYKEFGRMGRKVSEIGMGTYYDPLWIVTAFFGWKRGAQRKISAIKRGLELNINLIDTAEIYGSEPLVREAISSFKREELFIATKVWPNHLRRDDLKKALQKSLTRLGTKYIDLYQIHWPNPKVPIKETMSAMEDLIEQGKILGVGVSNFNLQQIIEANNSLRKSELASVQMNYSLLHRKIERDILPYCEREKIAILAYYPLAHGKLISDPRLEKFCSKYSKTPAQIALNWLITKKYVFPIPRASNPIHVEENAGASGWTLSQEDITELNSLFQIS